MTSRFVRTDRAWQPAPRTEHPALLLDEREFKASPPLRIVGVLEVTSKLNRSADTVLAEVLEAGARVGCDAVAQADLFLLDGRLQPGYAGFIWWASDEGAWQFLCGVRGDEAGSWKGRDLAIRTAERMRQEQIGTVCDRSPPTGSHIPVFHVCAERKSAPSRGWYR